MVELELFYLDDDDEPKKAGPPKPTTPTQAPPSVPRPSVPQGPAGSAWYGCATSSCSHQGYVATGSDRPLQRVKWGRCKECRGTGIDVDSDGSGCDHCGGKGRVKLREWEEDPNPECPYCHQKMIFMERGMQPEGYPRMETPHTDDTDPNFRGQVSFGRTRKISLE